MQHIAKSVLAFSALLAFLPILACAQTRAPQTVTAGPYEVTLNQSSVDMKTPLVTLTVRKDGKLATDLLPYLGTSGLADFTDTKTGAVFHSGVNPAGTATFALDVR